MRGETVSNELRPHRFCGLPAVMRPVDNLGLLRSCRAAYAEARNMLYSQNVFAFDDVGHFISWANGLEASALREIRRLEVYTVFSGREPGWNDLAAVFERMRPSIQLSVVGDVPSALKDRLELTLAALSNADASCAAAEVIHVPYKGHRGSADATGVGDDNAGIQAFNPVDEGPAEHDDILIMGE